jgi:hypothetical protein
MMQLQIFIHPNPDKRNFSGCNTLLRGKRLVPHGLVPDAIGNFLAFKRLDLGPSQMKFSAGRAGAVKLIPDGTGLQFIDCHMIEFSTGSAGILGPNLGSSGVWHGSLLHMSASLLPRRLTYKYTV